MNSGVADGPKRVRQTSRKLRQVRATTPPTIPEEEDYPTALRTYSLYEDDYGLGHGRGRGEGVGGGKEGRDGLGRRGEEGRAGVPESSAYCTHSLTQISGQKIRFESHYQQH